MKMKKNFKKKEKGERLVAFKQSFTLFFREQMTY